MEQKRKLIDLAERRYYYFADRSFSMQNDLIRTYLWSASLACTLAGFVLRDHGGFGTLHGLIAASSGCISLGVIILCIDTLRGRGMNLTLPLGECYSHISAYSDHPGLLEDHLFESLDESTLREIKSQGQRSVKLRVSSLALVFSFILLAVSIVVLAAESTTFTRIKEVIMHG